MRPATGAAAPASLAYYSKSKSTLKKSHGRTAAAKKAPTSNYLDAKALCDLDNMHQKKTPGRRLSSAAACRFPGCGQLHRYGDGYCHLHRGGKGAGVIVQPQEAPQTTAEARADGWAVAGGGRSASTATVIDMRPEHGDGQHHQTAIDVTMAATVKRAGGMTAAEARADGWAVAGGGRSASTAAEIDMRPERAATSKGGSEHRPATGCGCGGGADSGANSGGASGGGGSKFGLRSMLNAVTRGRGRTKSSGESTPQQPKPMHSTHSTPSMTHHTSPMHASPIKSMSSGQSVSNMSVHSAAHSAAASTTCSTRSHGRADAVSIYSTETVQSKYGGVETSSPFGTLEIKPKLKANSSLKGHRNADQGRSGWLDHLTHKDARDAQLQGATSAFAEAAVKSDAQTQACHAHKHSRSSDASSLWLPGAESTRDAQFSDLHSDFQSVPLPPRPGHGHGHGHGPSGGGSAASGGSAVGGGRRGSATLDRAVGCSVPGCRQLHRYADGFCHLHRRNANSSSVSDACSEASVQAAAAAMRKELTSSGGAQQRGPSAGGHNHNGRSTRAAASDARMGAAPSSFAQAAKKAPGHGGRQGHQHQQAAASSGGQHGGRKHGRFSDAHNMLGAHSRPDGAQAGYAQELPTSFKAAAKAVVAVQKLSTSIRCLAPRCKQHHRYADGFCHLHRKMAPSAQALAATSTWGAKSALDPHHTGRTGWLESASSTASAGAQLQGATSAFAEAAKKTDAQAQACKEHKHSRSSDVTLAWLPGAQSTRDAQFYDSHSDFQSVPLPARPHMPWMKTAGAQQQQGAVVHGSAREVFSEDGRSDT
jgi:hypothetical protein